MRKRSLYWTLFGVVVILWIAVSVYYRVGERGVTFTSTGTTVSFDRQFDVALFKVKGKGLAIEATHDDFFALVRTHRAAFPFCPLCGTYEAGARLVNVVEYYKDGWLYEQPRDVQGEPRVVRQFMYSLKTGELVTMPKNATQGDERDVLAAHALVIDDRYRLTPKVLSGLTVPVSTVNESCVGFNVPFLFVMGAWLLVGGVLLVVRLGRARGRAPQPPQGV